MLHELPDGLPVLVEDVGTAAAVLLILSKATDVAEATEEAMAGDELTAAEDAAADVVGAEFEPEPEIPVVMGAEVAVMESSDCTRLVPAAICVGPGIS